MTNVTLKSARCLCGAVQIQAEPVSNCAGACHCKMCRRWSGGPLMAIDCGLEVSIEGDEHLTVYNSSAWAERGFCNKCGSNLFYRLKESGQYMLSVGILDDQDDVVFDHQVFIDEKPSYYDFSNETHNMTGAELFAQFQASPPE